MAYPTARVCRNCPTIRATRNPQFETPFQALTPNQKRNALAATFSYWSPNPPVTPAQMEYYQQQTAAKALPYMVNEGLATSRSTIKDFYT